MGNCAKAPKGRGPEEVKANQIPNRNNPGANNPVPRSYNQPSPGNTNYPTNRNIPNQPIPPNNQNLPQHPYASSPHINAYRPSPPNYQVRAPIPPGPPGPLGPQPGPPAGYGYPQPYPQPYPAQPYPAQSGPASSQNQNGNPSLMIAETKSVSRLCRIIDDKLMMIENSDGSSWINFRYKSLYPAKVTIHYFSRERFDKNSGKHFFFANPNTLPKTMTFDVVEGENVEFVNQYKASFNNVSADLLEVKDKLTYPIVVEIECKSRENRTDEQVCVNCYKISKEGDRLVPSIVKQFVRINGIYRTLTNFYGTSANEDESECLICLTEKKNVAVLPCRHVIYCETCMNEIAKKSKNECPICRTSVSSFLKVHQ